MVLIQTKDRCYRSTVFPKDPSFFTIRKSQIHSPRKERLQKVYPEFPPIDKHNFAGFLYRLAVPDDLNVIYPFVDRLLSGGDCFIPRGQHIGYFKYKTILLTFDADKLIGWAVRQKDGSLIHLLVAPDYRGKGIGTHLLKLLNPLFVRSKFDQSTGDPLPFYEKHGYHKTSDERIGKHKNIDLLSK